MTKKIGKKGKIGEIKSAETASEVESTGAIGGIHKVKPTSAVGGVSGAGKIGKRGATRIMSAAEREELLRMIDQEAEKMFGNALPSEKRKAVVQAVKMAVDSGISAEEGEED